jgi:hypothetical protein
MNTSELENNPLPPIPKPQRHLLRRIAILAALSFVGFIVWSLFFPHIVRTSGPVSLDQAKDCPIPLPASARNIQYYRRIQFNFFIEFVKFEAPVQDCLGHVKTVQDDWRKTFDEHNFYPLGPSGPIKEPPMRCYLAEEQGVTWFDRETIQEGITVGSVGSCAPMIWIDTKRGIFYYLLTD